MDYFPRSPLEGSRRGPLMTGGLPFHPLSEPYRERYLPRGRLPYPRRSMGLLVVRSSQASNGRIRFFASHEQAIPFFHSSHGGGRVCLAVNYSLYTSTICAAQMFPKWDLARVCTCNNCDLCHCFCDSSSSQALHPKVLGLTPGWFYLREKEAHKS